jgi:hypothetical protein
MRSLKVSETKYENNLNIGIVQTTLQSGLAWPISSSIPKISKEQDNLVWLELCKAFRAFQDDHLTPRFVLIPELSLPRTRLYEFNRLVATLNVIAIVGVDYKLNKIKRTAMNQGLIFVPRNFFSKKPSKRCTTISFGKAYPSPKELSKLQNIKPNSWSFLGDNNVYIIDCEEYGNVGISICYDFMDIERALMYRGRIQHLFVLAHNKDINLFQSIANSLSRTIYCNVVVCNTGFFGGSLVVSPYYDPWRRTLFQHNGQMLYTTQVVSIPVHGIINAQKGFIKEGNKQIWKEPAPGVKEIANKGKTPNLKIKVKTLQ